MLARACLKGRNPSEEPLQRNISIYEAERRSRPSRITCSKARSTRTRLGPVACVPVSLFRRLPGWIQRIHPVALTAARTTLVQGFPYTAIKVQVDAEHPARMPEKPLT